MQLSLLLIQLRITYLVVIASANPHNPDKLAKWLLARDPPHLRASTRLDTFSRVRAKLQDDPSDIAA
jgi:hypothetical protein